jgi:hypothetical protein
MAPDKLSVMVELLKDAWVYVHLDPRREGVVLPDFLREQPRVVLQYGYNMPVPIVDLMVDEQGIGATLSFRRVAQGTFIPWSAVFALTDGEKRGMVWEEDVPKDLDLESEAAAPPPPKPPATAPKLGSVPGGGPTSALRSSSAGATKKPRPSHLKLVD